MRCLGVVLCASALIFQARESFAFAGYGPNASDPDNQNVLYAFVDEKNASPSEKRARRQAFEGEWKHQRGAGFCSLAQLREIMTALPSLASSAGVTPSSARSGAARTLPPPPPPAPSLSASPALGASSRIPLGPPPVRNGLLRNPPQNITDQDELSRVPAVGGEGQQGFVSLQKELERVLAQKSAAALNRGSVHQTSEEGATSSAVAPTPTLATIPEEQDPFTAGAASVSLAPAAFAKAAVAPVPAPRSSLADKRAAATSPKLPRKTKQDKKKRVIFELGTDFEKGDRRAGVKAAHVGRLPILHADGPVGGPFADETQWASGGNPTSHAEAVRRIEEIEEKYKKDLGRGPEYVAEERASDAFNNTGAEAVAYEDNQRPATENPSARKSGVTNTPVADALPYPGGHTDDREEGAWINAYAGLSTPDRRSKQEKIKSPQAWEEHHGTITEGPLYIHGEARAEKVRAWRDMQKKTVHGNTEQSPSVSPLTPVSSVTPDEQRVVPPPSPTAASESFPLEKLLLGVLDAHVLPHLDGKALRNLAQTSQVFFKEVKRYKNVQEESLKSLCASVPDHLKDKLSIQWAASSTRPHLKVCSTLSGEQFANLPTKVIQALDISRLEEQQLSRLPPTVIQSLTPKQVEAVIGFALPETSYAEFRAMCDKGVERDTYDYESDFRTMTRALWLRNKGVKNVLSHLTTEQCQALPPFSQENFVMLPGKIWQSLPGQVPRITTQTLQDLHDWVKAGQWAQGEWCYDDLDILSTLPPDRFPILSIEDVLRLDYFVRRPYGTPQYFVSYLPPTCFTNFRDQPELLDQIAGEGLKGAIRTKVALLP